MLLKRRTWEQQANIPKALSILFQIIGTFPSPEVCWRSRCYSASLGAGHLGSCCWGWRGNCLREVCCPVGRWGGTQSSRALSLELWTGRSGCPPHLPLDGVNASRTNSGLLWPNCSFHGVPVLGGGHCSFTGAQATNLRGVLHALFFSCPVSKPLRNLTSYLQNISRIWPLLTSHHHLVSLFPGSEWSWLETLRGLPSHWGQSQRPDHGRPGCPTSPGRSRTSRPVCTCGHLLPHPSARPVIS